MEADIGSPASLCVSGSLGLSPSPLMQLLRAAQFT
jgi:hypothetical protein